MDENYDDTDLQDNDQLIIDNMHCYSKARSYIRKFAFEYNWLLVGLMLTKKSELSYWMRNYQHGAIHINRNLAVVLFDEADEEIKLLMTITKKQCSPGDIEQITDGWEVLPKETNLDISLMVKEEDKQIPEYIISRRGIIIKSGVKYTISCKIFKSAIRTTLDFSLYV